MQRGCSAVQRIRVAGHGEISLQVATTSGIGERTRKTSLLQKATLDYPTEVLSFVIKVPPESANQNQAIQNERHCTHNILEEGSSWCEVIAV